MKSIENFFLKDLLSHLRDPFERARAKILLRIILLFCVILFAIPLIIDLNFHYYKAFKVHLFSFFLLVIVLFLLRYYRNLDLLLNITFFVFFLIQLILNLCIFPENLTVISFSWHFLFVVMGVLMLKGKSRVLFVGFLFWIIPVYVVINHYLHGLLTIPYFAESVAVKLPLITSFIPVFATIYVLFTYSALISDSQLLIEHQRFSLESKNREITDSIVYSKRIQSAIMPSIQEFKAIMPKSLVYYKPKDIVCGDFYFIESEGDKIYLAVADCTGHGIPGAFMSIVAIKELVIAHSLSKSPGEILRRVNNQLKRTMRQNQFDAAMDGMDIALIKLEGKVLWYSGANRPLWLIRKDSECVEIFKASRNAIGGYTPTDYEFEEHEIHLNSGDVFYLFSDGYADQFGGDKVLPMRKGGHKMTTKRFQEFLLTICNDPIVIQEQKIKAFFLEWKGNYSQVDDVLVVGVRV